MVEQFKRLRKSSDKKLAGVCAGIAETFNLDPTVVRVVTVLLGAGVILPARYTIITYIILALVLPEA